MARNIFRTKKTSANTATAKKEANKSPKKKKLIQWHAAWRAIFQGHGKMRTQIFHFYRSISIDMSGQTSPYRRTKSSLQLKRLSLRRVLRVCLTSSMCLYDSQPSTSCKEKKLKAECRVPTNRRSFNVYISLYLFARVDLEAKVFAFVLSTLLFTMFAHWLESS